MSFTTTTTLFNPAPYPLVRVASTLRGHDPMDTTPDVSAPPQTTTSRKRKRQQNTPFAPTRTQPKRQRPWVSYAEIDSDDELINDSDAEAAEDVESDYDFAPRRKPRNTRPLPKHKIFPFLSLPRELRDMIYQECLIDPIGALYLEERTIRYRRHAVRVAQGPQDYISNYSRSNAAMPAWPHPDDHPHDSASPLTLHHASLAPGLLGACQQIRAEAAPLLYGQRFVFEDSCALHGLLAGLAPGTRGLLRDVTVLDTHRWRSMKKFADGASLALLADGAANLASLTYPDSCVGWGNSAKHAARRFYRRAFRWLEAVSRVKGVVAAVEVVRLGGSDWDMCLEECPGALELFRKELRVLMKKNMRG
ncbi:hypothetical protein UCRNP2_5158 [Neofusicoccum parvum UCRNP2]|uniref:Uncharacterized protein n=1 Tax=Botryosphaeria parva (strain UCR-NP2) TaxID=1287680 RepID=R1EKN0_BOTPV|nr:hypothetical protein UCRNP2_5158 [Neofusicoccum parvum UCRNP2]